jgi:Spy/CpxP family protein refolding chaperone
MRRLTLIFAFISIAARAFAQSPVDEADDLKQKAEKARAKAELSLAQVRAQLPTPAPFSVSISPLSRNDLSAAFETGLQGTWWREPRWIQELNLTPEQQKKMDEAFRQNRIKLIDLNATLEKAELMLEPLVENVKPGDETKILAQIDHVADARADLEKANARMLLSIREVLTQEQWSKLPSSRSNVFLRRRDGIFTNPK